MDEGAGPLPPAHADSIADPPLLAGGDRPARRARHRRAVAGAAAGRALTREGYVPVHRGSRRAPDALRYAADALATGRSVLSYPEGGLPRYRASHDRPPGRLKSGEVRLALSTGAPVMPIVHAGARRVSSGSRAEQPAGRATAPVRRPRVHVYVGPALRLATSDRPPDDLETALAEAWTRAVVSAPRR
ncbi:lysophospholipid acyltransferase family protein [Streptomyces sp. NPDC020192]|uniref:lysophospholipid acyltransferase family protein n=1 Tax=Streptomyces sp. NPDC020192 TaxID=3365066 RepID=UPI00379B7BFB